MPSRSGASRRFELMRQALRQRVDGATGARTACGDRAMLERFRRRGLGSLFVPPGADDGFAAACRLVWDVQRRALHQLGRRLGTLPYAFFKGADLTRRFFPSHPIGFIDDIDLIVADSHADDLVAVLHGLGYRRRMPDGRGGYPRIGYRDMLAVESAHYELVPFVLAQPVGVPQHLRPVLQVYAPDTVTFDGRSALVWLQVDVHLRPVLDIDADQVLSRAGRFGHGASAFMHVADSDYMWLLPAKYHAEVLWHRKKSLRELFYLAHVARQGQVDWGHVVAQARSHGVQRHCVAVYGLLQSMSDDLVPRSLVGRLAAGMGLDARALAGGLARIV